MMIRISYYSLIYIISGVFIICCMLFVGVFFEIIIYFTLLCDILIYRALHDTFSLRVNSEMRFFSNFQPHQKAQPKAYKWLKTALFGVAERVGFEPARPFRDIMRRNDNPK